MNVEGIPSPKGPSYPYSFSGQRDWSQAQLTYNNAIKGLFDSSERHAEVGILLPNGTSEIKQLGKKENYGSHRVGSVTKTFTTFLALKLIHDGVLPEGLSTKLTSNELFDREFLERVFENPELAQEMTLEQLLSHTSGIEYGDHSREQKVSAPTLYDRFVQEAKEGRKYRHIVHPGDRIGCYSNAGLAVAGLMLEKAYNDHNNSHLSFAQIMQKELFELVFNMKESSIKSGPSKDPIQSPAGDMNSSVPDLIEAARVLQQGEQGLERFFGKNWQSQMLAPRDLLQGSGLGCETGSTSIIHKGLNRELFGNEERDVSAIVIFPLSSNQSALVAMCDSNALGPSDEGQKFIHELESLVLSKKIEKKGEELRKEPPLEFYCPKGPNICFFQGNAYLLTDQDPFQGVPDKIHCSLNGVPCTLTREPKLDKDNARGYTDQDGGPWLIIETKDKREIILSQRCLLNQRRQDVSLTQPGVETIRSLRGVYRNAINPDTHPTFTFTESGGNLFIQVGMGKNYPCLYIPEKKAWVSAMAPTMLFQFPENPDDSPLIITDIFSGDQQLPKECHRVKRF